MDEQVSFNDVTLEETIRFALKTPTGPIAYVQMHRITEFGLNKHPKILDISFL